MRNSLRAQVSGRMTAGKPVEQVSQPAGLEVAHHPAWRCLASFPFVPLVKQLARIRSGAVHAVRVVVGGCGACVPS